MTLEEMEFVKQSLDYLRKEDGIESTKDDIVDILTATLMRGESLWQ